MAGGAGLQLWGIGDWKEIPVGPAGRWYEETGRIPQSAVGSHSGGVALAVCTC